MNAFVFVVAALATFRLARLFAKEEGPAALFRNLRQQVPAKTNPGRGVRCPFCWSVWIAAVLTGYLWWLGEVPTPFTPLYALALSGVSVFIHVWQAE